MVYGIKTHYRLAALLLVFSAPALSFAQDADADQEEGGETSEALLPADEDPIELSAQTVTGSRLEQGDPSARIEVIKETDIASRGFSTAEDIVRSIPQNFSSINGTTNLQDNGAGDVSLGSVGLGISTANLRGLGSANTLVLLNGRRMAGASGEADFFANLRDIPAAAIERVEVHLDGGSSIYGSDAVGGIINIITRSDYAGVHFATRREQSSTGANQTRYDTRFGYNWGNGGATASVSYTESSPYSARKAGHTTNDWSAAYDGNEDANFNLEFGEPRYYSSSVVSTESRWGLFDKTLGVGNDGRNAQPEDFRAPTLADGLEELPLDAGGSTADTSITLSAEHRFADRLRLRGEYLRTEAETGSRVTRNRAYSIAVPASNAFNHFGQDVWVLYNPQTEVDLGVLPPPLRDNATTSERFVAGFDVTLTDHLEFTFDYFNSTSDGEDNQVTFHIQVDENFGDPAIEARIQELLASSDPNEAINLFGDGTGQNPTITELMVPISTSFQGSETNSIESYLRGTLFDLPAGPISFVAGMEMREELLSDGAGTLQIRLGVSKPGRELDAWFVELSAPIFADRNARPGLNSLKLTLQARRDDYSSEGANGQEPVDPADPFGEQRPIIETASFAHTSPRIGVYWRPVEDLTVRASWGEAFRAPTFSDLFSTFARTSHFGAFDPLLGRWVPGAMQTSGPSPDLKPEQSDNRALGVQWRPAFWPELSIKANWSMINFQDRIASSYDVGTLTSPEEYGNMPEFFVRDANGNLLEFIRKSINIATTVSETLDLQVSWQLSTDNYGLFIPSLYYHRVLDQYDQITPGADKVRLIGKSTGIDEYKLQGRLEWLMGRLTVNLFLQYTPEYLNTNFVDSFWDLPVRSIDSRITADLSATWRWDGGLTARLGGRNVFDADFPFALDSSGAPYDASRVDLRGQVWFAELSYDFDF